MMEITLPLIFTLGLISLVASPENGARPLKLEIGPLGC